MKMPPTPAKIGRNRTCAPVKYSASSPARITLLRNCFILVAGRLGSYSEASRKPLKKQLAGRLTSDRSVPWYFEFDSLARVCFLWFQTPRRISNARTFQVEQQMVAGYDSPCHHL